MNAAKHLTLFSNESPKEDSESDFKFQPTLLDFTLDLTFTVSVRSEINSSVFLTSY